jgi:hypothetical protein
MRTSSKKAPLKRLALICCASLLATTASAIAEDKAPAAAASAEDPKKKEMMDAFMKYATPGESHKALGDMAGKWKYKWVGWEEPNAKPMESTGTSTMKPILGGRFMQNEMKGKFMGMPYEGMALIGYDNLKTQYETLWVDNMSTGMMRGTGSFDTASKTLKDSGEFSCPMSDDKDRDYNSGLKIVDKNKMVYAMYGEPAKGGDKFKMMEITYTRAGK